MLTYESLIAQAKLRGMPHLKMRGILREYLQVLILKEFYKTEAAKKLFFTGGTYLRLVHGLKRFSEDLDFNAQKLSKKEFELILNRAATELKRTGLKAQVKFSHWGNIYAAKIIFPQIEKDYAVISQYSKKAGIVIKAETNSPKWKVRQKAEIISGFGELYPCLCTDAGQLFADKIDALAKKNRARHIYDIIFMLANKFPIDRKVLFTFGVKEEPLEFILRQVKNLSGAGLKKQAENLRPFLFEESEANLIRDAHRVIPALIEKY